MEKQESPFKPLIKSICQDIKETLKDALGDALVVETAYLTKVEDDPDNLVIELYFELGDSVPVPYIQNLDFSEIVANAIKGAGFYEDPTKLPHFVTCLRKFADEMENANADLFPATSAQ